MGGGRGAQMITILHRGEGSLRIPQKWLCNMCTTPYWTTTWPDWPFAGTSCGGTYFLPGKCKIVADGWCRIGSWYLLMLTDWFWIDLWKFSEEIGNYLGKFWCRNNILKISLRQETTFVGKLKIFLIIFLRFFWDKKPMQSWISMCWMSCRPGLLVERGYHLKITIISNNFW